MPNIYPLALLMTGEKLSSSDTPFIYSDYKAYANLTELYFSLNARFYLKNSTRYALRCESFMQSEYANVFVHLLQQPPLKKNQPCHLNLSSKLVYLSQTEFHQIVLWSSEFSKEANVSSPLAHLNARIVQIDELLSILSLKIQPHE